MILINHNYPNDLCFISHKDTYFNPNSSRVRRNGLISNR